MTNKTGSTLWALFFTGCVLLFRTVSYSQTGDYYNYSDEKLELQSGYLQESITCHFHLPETYTSSDSSTRYPVVILFDSQHEKTYPHLINGIDLLTSESQFPEAIIVGVPFTRQNRYYFTSAHKNKGDSLSGIERMSLFIFDELVPRLRDQYKGNDFLALIGHSRTAFLTNYLLAQNNSDVDLVIAASGFYNNEPLGTETMKKFLSGAASFSSPVRYYFSAGTSLEEKIYYDQCSEIATFLREQPNSPLLNWQFIENQYANHMPNYWLTVPVALMDAFSAYNFILNNWFSITNGKESPENPIEQFKNDLEYCSKQLGFQVNPGLTQLFSLANTFAQKEDYKTAIDFLLLGHAYYPDYTEFDETLAYYYGEMGNKEKAAFWQSEYDRKTGK